MQRVFAVLVVALISLPAIAAENPPPATQEFIDKAAVSNKFEIDTSQLALEYGKGEDVRS